MVVPEKKKLCIHPTNDYVETWRAPSKYPMYQRIIPVTNIPIKNIPSNVISYFIFHINYSIEYIIIHHLFY